jgi:hypothetical protein
LTPRRHLIVFPASERVGYITGEFIAVEGEFAKRL